MCFVIVYPLTHCPIEIYSKTVTPYNFVSVLRNGTDTLKEKIRHLIEGSMEHQNLFRILDHFSYVLKANVMFQYFVYLSNEPAPMAHTKILNTHCCGKIIFHSRSRLAMT